MHWAILRQARRQVVPRADLIAYLKRVNQTPECGKQTPLDSR